MEEETFDEKSEQIKKDLRKVLTVVGILILALVGLFIFDKMTGQLSQWAERLINLAVGR